MTNELHEEFARLRQEGVDVAAAAIKEKREVTAEEKEANAKRFARCNQIKDQLDEQARFASLAVAELPQEVLDVAKGQPSESKAKQEFDRGQNGGKFTMDAHKAAVNKYVHTGSIPHELFTIVAGSGGIALPASPPVFVKQNRNPFKAALQAYGVPVLRTEGYVNIPLIDESGNTADTIAQNYVGDNPKDPTITNMLAGDVITDSGTRWVNQLVLNSIPDLFSYYVPVLQNKVEEKATLAFTTQILATATVGVTTASTSAITYPEFVAWRFSLPAVYQNDAVILASNGFLQAVWSLVDSTGRPLYVESLSESQPNTFMGIPIFLDASLGHTANNVTAILASASSLVIRESGPQQIVRYEGESAHPFQVGLRVLQAGGTAFMSAGVRLLKLHA